MAAEPAPRSDEQIVPGAFHPELEVVDGASEAPFLKLAEAYPKFATHREHMPQVDWDRAALDCSFFLDGADVPAQLKGKDFFLSSDGRFAMARPSLREASGRSGATIVEHWSTTRAISDNHHSEWQRYFEGLRFRPIEPAEKAALERHFTLD